MRVRNVSNLKLLDVFYLRLRSCEYDMHVEGCQFVSSELNKAPSNIFITIRTLETSILPPLLLAFDRYATLLPLADRFRKAGE